LASLRRSITGSSQKAEDGAVIDQLITLRRDIQGLGYEGIANGIGLGGCCCLARLLGHRPLLYAYQGLAVGAVEDIQPSGLARLGQSLARHAVIIQIKQDHRVGRIEVPDVVMNLLEVPAVLTGVDIQRHDGRSKQVIPGAHRAVVVGPGIAG
jgi:hypothetical protein